MRIFITGGTGLIGRALCRALRAEGHELTVLSRHPERVAAKCGAGVQAVASLAAWTPHMAFDAVINLAGEPIVDARWSARRKQVLWDSRVTLTDELVRRINLAEHKPAVLLSGSAVGFYGDRGDTVLDENASAGTGFSAELCQAWEQAALVAEKNRVRVCLLRTAPVLSREGGLLGKMLLPFKLGMGARLGDGRQWMSWIHIDDHVALTVRLLHDPQAHGVFNLAAPEPATNRAFTAALAQAVRRPAWFVAPAWLLRLGMGERASLLLEGQRVVPGKFVAAGHPFRFPSLGDALRDVIG
ncbi:TIGR01777 family oxidoreductase [Ferrigenium sp. UT5]|uniref:TIGR01777 family oxidoreductase n=1 Tax=Ferrigenium sp. UT5 TaxID=3242105 RepID=UPI00354F9006